MSSHTKNKRESIQAGIQMCVVAQRQEHLPPPYRWCLSNLCEAESLRGLVQIVSWAAAPLETEFRRSRVWLEVLHF